MDPPPPLLLRVQVTSDTRRCYNHDDDDDAAAAPPSLPHNTKKLFSFSFILYSTEGVSYLFVHLDVEAIRHFIVLSKNMEELDK
jgi:hypothetical protein